MEYRTGIYFILQIFGFSIVACEKRASVGNIDNAPKYGTYPHKCSNDQFMDPCKACKYL